MSKSKKAADTTTNGNGVAVAAATEAAAIAKKAKAAAEAAKLAAKSAIAEAKAAAKKARAAQAAAKYTRLDSMLDALKELGLEAELKAIAARADELFVEHGGKGSVKASTWRTRDLLNVIKAIQASGLSI